MQICSSDSELKIALTKVKPTRIAVAYVGREWKKLIKSENLKEIILSPTLGSNPIAIEELMKEIGSSNVHFLDDLHAKIYLGKACALVGSSNLSKNGFSRLSEVGVLLSDREHLNRLEDIFTSLKEKAIGAYPNKKSKDKKLEELTEKWKLSIIQGLTAKELQDKSPSIASFNSKPNGIHISWYVPDKVVYNKEAITDVVKLPGADDPDKYFEDDLGFVESDPVNVGDWILAWRCRRSDGKPYKNSPISWMYVHHVVPNGHKDEGKYTKLVGQAKHLFCPPEPFSLDMQTKTLIRNALSSGKFPELTELEEDDNKPWRLSDADRVVPKFIAHLREQAKSIKSKAS